MSISPLKLLFPNNIYRIINAYWDKNGCFAAALNDLAGKTKEGEKRMESLSKEALLVGEWGLTGVCMGYALECVNWVEQHEFSRSLPPLMTGRPQESIRHLEKLLILAVYQAIPKGDDPKNLIRAQNTKETINRVAAHYQGLQQRKTGVQMVEYFPGPDFSSAAPLTSLLPIVESICQDACLTSKDHFVFVMNFPGIPIFDWHVIYMNPRLGIIGDAATGLLWRINQNAHAFFFYVFAKFVKQHDYENRDTVIMKLQVNPRLASHTPLLLSRLFRRTQTMLTIAKKSTWTQGLAYLQVIHRERALAKRFFANKKQVIEELQELFKKHHLSEELYRYVAQNIHGISQLTVNEMRAPFIILVQDLPNPDMAKRWLNVLEKLQALGPRVHLFCAYLQRYILSEICVHYQLEKHHISILIPGILKLRAQMGEEKRFDLDKCMADPNAEPEWIPYYDLLIQAGANPNGSEDQRIRGDSPLDVAIQEGYQETVVFLKSKGATVFR